MGIDISGVLQGREDEGWKSIRTYYQGRRGLYAGAEPSLCLPAWRRTFWRGRWIFKRGASARISSMGSTKSAASVRA